jgi:hypothetical protein
LAASIARHWAAKAGRLAAKASLVANAIASLVAAVAVMMAAFAGQAAVVLSILQSSKSAGGYSLGFSLSAHLCNDFFKNNKKSNTVLGDSRSKREQGDKSGALTGDKSANGRA